jgi:hypothetical protein
VAHFDIGAAANEMSVEQMYKFEEFEWLKAAFVPDRCERNEY